MCPRSWSRFATIINISLSLFAFEALGVCACIARAQDRAEHPQSPAEPPSPPRDSTATDAHSETADRDDGKPADSASSKQSNKPRTRRSQRSSDEKVTASSSKDKQADNGESKTGAEDTNAKKGLQPSEKSSKKSSDNEDKQTDRVIRLLELSGSYVDLMQPASLDPTALLMGNEPLKSKSFYRLCEYVSGLAKDESVSHIVFDLSDAGLSMNPAQLDEITRRLARLNEAGKHTLAWLENPGNVHIALAAACDEVVLADFGGVDLPSLSMQSMFFRDAMDLIGIQASVVRAGDFKGAVEPFLNPQMSEHLRQHYVEMLSAINDAQVDRIARGRGLTVAEVRELQKQRLLLPEQALEKGLVDRLAPYGSMRETIDDMVGESLEWTKPKASPRREMSVFELMSRLMSGDKKSAGSTKEGTIAVLHMSGAIEDGKRHSPGSIVSGPTVEAIEEIADDDKVKAVVVRINSPGGSATASEAVRRALEELAQQKPTVVSMGEMAASGGYWIACIGQPIYAEKGTITGSIGVFSLKFSLGSLMRRVGVHVEAIALDDAAKLDVIDRPWNENDMQSMQCFVDDVYEKFLKLVSKSRKIPVKKLEALAGGRVWSGTQAKQHKLIDEIGGLDDCLAAVAKKAKLDKYEIIHRPVVKSGIDLLELLGEEDPNEIELRSLVPLDAMRAIARQGFHMQATRALLRSGLKPQSGLPKVWALCPNEIAIR